jgi:hypothetical protein
MSDVGTTTPSSALGIAAGTSPDIASQLYGYMGWAISIPEVAAILKKAAADAQAGVGWSQAQMDAALQATNWWKTTDSNKRAWLEKAANDPATADDQVAQKADDIHSQLVQQGVELDPGVINQIARQSLEFGWDDVQMKAALDSELQRSPSVLQSQVGTNYRAMARQYATNLSDTALQGWAADSIAGVKSDDQFRQYLVQQAKSLFRNNADLGKFLDDGGTVDQYGDVFKQDAAQTLGVDPNTIDFTDPKWSAALNAQQMDQAGKPVGQVGPMTRQEWIQKMKSDPLYGWSKTANGINELVGTASNLMQQFGFQPTAGGAT